MESWNLFPCVYLDLGLLTYRHQIFSRSIATVQGRKHIRWENWDEKVTRRVLEESYRSTCSTWLIYWGERRWHLPAGSEGGGESVRCLRWVHGLVKLEVRVMVIKLHESLQCTGEPQNTRKQNPLGFSLSLSRNFCQGFEATYGLWFKEEAHGIRNSLQILIDIWRKWGRNIFCEAPGTEKKWMGGGLGENNLGRI